MVRRRSGGEYVDGRDRSAAPRRPTIRGSCCRSGTRRSGSAARRRSRRATSDLPFANFYFGGFGNNWVDHLDEKRYRRVSSFPGVDAERDRRPQLRQVAQSNGTCRRGASAASGMPGFYATWAAAGGVRRRRLPPISMTPSARRAGRQRRRADGRAVRRAVDAGADPVVRRRDCVRGRPPPRREAMISLKILRR